MASATPSISQDASSLRAAALLTIKAKAKRPHPPAEANHQQDDTSSVASTRRAAPSPELNYGSDDGLADAEGSTEEEEEEDGEKEEGEISDDDAAGAAKHTHTMMDVDNEPLPGLNSSSDRFQVSGSMTFSETKASNPSSHQQDYPESSISPNKSTPPDAQLSASPLIHSTVMAKPPDVSKNLSLISSSSYHLSGQSAATVSRSRGLPVEHPVPAVPSSSSGLKTQPSNNDTPSQRDVPRSGGDRTGPAAPLDLPSSAVPAPSRQLSPNTSRPLVDHAHARPSMKMTAQEFMETKTIILDLLGWGVPSEYFINCGLTREAIYYAFTEMNLKLPANLNTDGIIPFGPSQGHTPRPNHESQPTSPVIHHLSGLTGDNGFASDRSPLMAGQSSGQTKSGTASYIAPHPLPPKPKRAPSPLTSPSLYESVRNQTVFQQASSQIGSNTSYPGKGNAVHNGYTPRPTSESQGGSSLSGSHGQHTTHTPSAPSGITKQSPSTRPALSVKSSSFRPEVATQQNLDDLETLRRQELLARKAVLASRKPKPVVSGSTVPNANQNPPRSKSPSTSSQSIPNDKAPVPSELVDDFLNSIASGTSPGKHPNRTDFTTDSFLTHSPDPIDMEIGTRSPEDEGPTLSEMTSTFHEGPHPHASHIAVPLRKGSNKRPVASDFVDYDVHPPKRGSPFASSPTYNGGSSSSGRSQERLVSTPSFSGLPPSGKVVIDFSDTDDDGVEHRPSDTVSKSLGSANVSRRSASVGVPTPKSKSPAPLPGINPITPTALLAKEQEIKRMKELIAERELNRLRKLLHAPKGTTPQGSQSPAPPAASVRVSGLPPVDLETSSSSTIVKQEETTDPVLPLQPRLEGDGLLNSVSVDIQDEDAVMNDIFTRDQSADMSTTSTPPCTDSVVGDLETAVTGEQVLTAEAGHEQVMDSKIVETSDEPQIQDIPFPVISLVSEEHEASSTRHISKHFSAYTSPLSYFSSFRSPTQLDSTLNTSSSYANPNFSSFTSSIPHIVDTPVSQQVPTLLRPLKEATLLKLDPKRSICQFEIPGAGKCRDQTCQNVHLRAFEPNDDEIARHLAKALPAPRPTMQEVKAALSSVRASSKKELDLDARVSQVLLHLGVR